VEVVLGRQQLVEWRFPPGQGTARPWLDSGPLAGGSQRTDVAARGGERIGLGQYGWHVEGLEEKRCGNVS
jgi:hypothetical protein